MKLRNYLIILVTISLLPVLIFAALMVFAFSGQQAAAQKANLTDAANAISLAIDRELLSWVRALEALATSKHLDTGNFQQFYEQAKPVVQGNDAWENLILSDPSGQQLVDLRRAFGSPLPSVGNLDLLKQVIKTGRPVISDLFIGPVSKKPLLTSIVPVIRGGEIRYVLQSGASPEFLSQFIEAQSLPAGWIVTILDKNGVIISRNQNLEKYFGQPASPSLFANSQKTSAGFFEGTTVDGVDVFAGVRRSDLSGWSVGVGLPRILLEAPVRRSLATIVIGGFFLLLVGIGLALVFGQRIARSINALCASADAVGRGETVPRAPTFIKEIAQVQSALEGAASYRRQAEQSLHDNEERLRLALRGGNIGTWHLDLISGRALWSDKCRDIFGVAPEAPVGRDLFLSLLHPEDRTRVRDAVQKALDHKESFDQEYRIIRPDGSVRWVTAKAQGYYDTAGTLIRLEGGMLDVTIRKQRAEQLQILSRKLVESQESERRHISRELHDEIGQILTGLKFTLVIAGQSGLDVAKTKLKEALEVVNDLMGRVRDLSLRFRPAMLDDLGLVPTLVWYLQNFTAQTKIKIDFEHAGFEKRVAPELETAAYRIVQEGLTNIARHAAVNQAKVRCRIMDGTLRLEIADQGVGFSPSGIASETAGLSGMTERALSLGGKLTIDAAPGAGTRIITEFPLGGRASQDTAMKVQS